MYRIWNAVLPPNAYFAAGLRQLTSDPVVLGRDSGCPFSNDSHFALLNNLPYWLAFEQLGMTNEVPMIRVSVRPVYTATPAWEPAPRGRRD